MPIHSPSTGIEAGGQRLHAIRLTTQRHRVAAAHLPSAISGPIKCIEWSLISP